MYTTISMLLLTEYEVEVLELLNLTLKFPSGRRGSLCVTTDEIKVVSYQLRLEIPRVMIGLPIVIKLIILILTSCTGWYYFIEKSQNLSFLQRDSLATRR